MNIIQRGNGIVNINISRQSAGSISYDNVTLRIKKNKVTLVKVYDQGTTFTTMYSYGGIYQLSAF